MGKEENDGPSLTRKFRALVTGRQSPLMGTGGIEAGVCLGRCSEKFCAGPWSDPDGLSLGPVTNTLRCYFI